MAARWIRVTGALAMLAVGCPARRPEPAPPARVTTPARVEVPPPVADASAAPPAEPEPDEPDVEPDAAPRFCPYDDFDAGAVKSLRDVDWCNCDIGHWMSLRDCRGNVHLYRKLSAPHDTIVTHLSRVSYCDLDGDGQEEAQLDVKQTWIMGQGGTSEHGRRLVFRLGEGAIQLMDADELGDAGCPP